MTVTLKKNIVDVRVELRRNDNDYIGEDRFYYAYFFTQAGWECMRCLWGSLRWRR